MFLRSIICNLTNRLVLIFENTLKMNRCLTLVLASLFSVLVFAQQKPTYQPTTYISPDGKLYIQKDLGLYVWLSTSEDENSKKYRLKSEESAKYSNPMYLDAEGFNSLRSPSAVDPETKKPIYPLQDIVFEVYADGLAPNTKTSFGDYNPFQLEGKLYVKGNTQLTLSASDAQSGVKEIMYSVNGEAYKQYTQAISFNEEKDYAIKYYAVDNVGNDEEVKEITVVYDKTPPATKREIDKDEHENIISARSTISLSAEDDGAGLKKIIYKINEGDEYAYKQAIRASYLSQGEHTLTYYSIDKVGNQEAAITYTFYVDKTAPTIIEEVIGKSFFANGKEFSSGKSQLKLTAFDNKAGVKEIKYSINDGEYLTYTKPVFLSQTSGNLTIKTYAVDNVNNKSTSQTANQKTAIPYIDLSGPTLSHSLSGPKFTARDTIFINSKTKISLKARDLESGVNRIEYNIDGASSVTFEEPFTLEKEGVHIISYIGYDNVENTSSAALIVKVDNSGPEINHQFSAATLGNSNTLPSYPKYVILFLSGFDNVTGLENIRYGFNDAPSKTYTIPITGFSSGEKLIKLTATDKLGNKTEKELKFHISE